MHIAIAGGSGFVGKALTEELLKQGHDVYILTRNRSNKTDKPGLAYIQWLNKGDRPEKQLPHIEAVINLAGTSLNSGRWTDKRKKDIVESRMTATTEVRRIMAALDRKPDVFLNASAIGYYGTSETETYTEEDVLPASDFLSETVHKWEENTSKAQTLGIRTVFMRFGVILDKEQGALPQILLPFKLFAGGPIGSGSQLLSWIHIHDIVRAALFCLEKKEISGPVNFTAPAPATMSAFGKTAAASMHRPYWLPVPSPMLKLALGEKSMLVLKGQRVLPKKLLDNGFKFAYPALPKALAALLHD
ncbi:TIGR01777 family oxidoreductase [Bacillus testis]|uniref:TIGR01777 family oxidoreductase n=1 Tax=Bacillus testis TaxID=1622072 RepID=UPI00067EB9E3|nr:TIGR01777 family oxidoreductase [Bacillus testis]